MYDFLVKKGTTVAFLVGIAVILIFLITTVSGLNSAGFDTSTDLMAQGKDAVAGMDFFDTGIGLTVLLIVIAIALMVFFGIVGLVKFPKAGVRSIATFAGLIILFFILRAVAPGDVGERIARIRDNFEVTDSISGYIGGGIATTLFLIVFAAVAMVFFEIRNAFK